MDDLNELTSYLVIGDGRMARHLRRYFDLEALPYFTWNRKQSSDGLRHKAERSSHVLLAISDRALAPFAAEHQAWLAGKVAVHFSGALSVPGLIGAHPLMTFSDRLYEAAIYRKIPFVLERGAGPLARVLPGLRNPFYEIDPKKKALYHTLCALSGNMTVLLWEKAFHEFARKLGLPKAVLLPYLEQIAANLEMSDAQTSVLTGPIARGDQAVIEAHLQALAGDPYQAVYQSFVNAHNGGHS